VVSNEKDLLAGSDEEVFVSTFSLYKILRAFTIPKTHFLLGIKNTFFYTDRTVKCKGITHLVSQRIFTEERKDGFVPTQKRLCQCEWNPPALS
jgi:hypothetical protein